jgi:quinol monooxygenase YgiN
MAPHITLFKIKAKPGHRQDVIDFFDRWMRDRRPGLGGFVRVLLCSSIHDDHEFMSYALFADKETYDKNSQSPEQTRWYEELRAHLVADPEWFDATLERQRVG